MNHRARRILQVLGAASAVGLSACFAAVPPELIDARLMYERASSGETRKLAPEELEEAASALRRAESQYQHAPRSEEARDLAYAAQRRVMIAQSRARLESLRRQKAASEQELAALHSRSASELAQARARLQEQEAARARLDAEQAERTRQEAERTRLEDEARALREQQAQRDELARVQQQLDEQQRQLQERQRELDQARQEREAAEASQRAALERLERFAQVREEQRGTVITLPGGLLFAPGRTDLSDGAQRALEQVALALKAAPEQRLVVEGHTDARGAEDFNYELSVLRANAVRDFLNSRGVERNRIESVGFGETRPIASNTSAEGRATNRRVEIIVERGVGGAGFADPQQ